ncbi:MAG TPA: hypothetical protein VJR94_07255, partial [Candidatus Nitrosocosmicus sp.]|nr:hypothetical protein [Candidatus Nitrosocosmicus sp.]
MSFTKQFLEMDFIFITGLDVSSITKKDIVEESSFTICSFQVGPVVSAAFSLRCIYIEINEKTMMVKFSIVIDDLV